MTQIEAMCKLLVDDGHMTPLAARKVLQVATIDADRLAKVQALVDNPVPAECGNDFTSVSFDAVAADNLREALGGEQ